MGYADAGLLVDDVVGSLEIKIVRLISDTFLWLAQVQTLIRLFPRHKEKVTIKWLGFALVSLDTIFSILDDFVNPSPRARPRSFQDAIPALDYLFELAISLIYASCVIYYSLSKRRFAFWHRRMRNICLVALLSLIAVLIPVVFFVLDVSKPDVAGWGDYIRWVGAAAASVVVWEWVERIEALERDDRKDGILGREIFDGDEMLDGPAIEEGDFPGRRQYWNRNGFPSLPPDASASGARGINMRDLRSRVPFTHRLLGGEARIGTDGNQDSSGTTVPMELAGHPAMPPQAASPVSRSDTTSAGSTIYAVHYHTVQTPARNTDEIATHIPPSRGGTTPEENSIPSSSETAAEADVPAVEKDANPTNADAIAKTEQDGKTETRAIPAWRSVPNPFKRRRASPPAEVAAQITESSARSSPAERTIALRERFVPTRRNRAGKAGPRGGADATPVAVTVIPAQRRGYHTWLPDENTEQEPVLDDMIQEQPQQQQRPQVSGPSLHPPISTSPAQLLNNYEMPVLIIPAPRRGQRTWSPEDAYHGPVMQSPISSPAPDPDPLPDEASIRSPVISTRGTLTISEDLARNHAIPNRRSTYTRNSAVEESSGSSSTSRSTPPAAASNQSLDRVLDQESSRSPESDPRH
jgi:PalH/RIM21